MRQVFLFDQDISDQVISIPEITSTAGDFGQLTINDLPSLEGNNTRRFWDKTNPASPFFQEPSLSKYPLEIYNDNLLVYRGVIQAIKSNNQNKTATVTLKSEVQSKLELGLVYQSEDVSNPAIMINEFCSLYKIDTDPDSFATASLIYETDLVRTTGHFLNEGTVLDAIQQICEVGCARVYSKDNKLFMDVFTDLDTDPIFTISDKSYRDTAVERRQGVTAFSHPEVSNVEKEPINGYKIDYVGDIGGHSVAYGSTIEQGKTIDGTVNSPIRIMNLQSATWVGERWLKYFAKDQNQVNVSIPSLYGKELGINYPVKIQYRDYEYFGEINSINNSLLLQTKLGILTR